MSETTPVSGLVIPEDLDILNTEAAFGQLAQSLDTYCIPRFATTAARDAAIAAPVEGMVCVVGGTVPALQRYTGSSWVFAEERHWALMTADVSHSTTTPANLFGLAIVLDSNATYILETVITTDGTVAASAVDYVLQLSYSGTLNGTPQLLGLAPAATASGNNTNVALASGSSLTFTYGSSSGFLPSASKWIVKTTTAGTLQLQGRQGTAGAEVVITQSFVSWMNVRRVA